MEENEVLVEETVESNEEFDNAFDDAWDDDSDLDDGPVDEDTADEHEEGQPDADHDETEDDSEEESEEPGAEAEEGHQLFKIKYNGNEEELTLDQMTELAQKGRDYDHVRGERDDLRGRAKDAEEKLAFLKDLADRAGLSVDEQIDRTRALWLMNDEFDKGNEISETEALLRVQRTRGAKATVGGQTEVKSKADAEIDRFMERYPDVRSENIPKEVWDEVSKTGDLLGSYMSWEIKHLKEENEKIKKEAQNERNSQRSTGPRKSSGTSQRVKDAFDEGWDSEF